MPSPCGGSQGPRGPRRTVATPGSEPEPAGWGVLAPLLPPQEKGQHHRPHSTKQQLSPLKLVPNQTLKNAVRRQAPETRGGRREAVGGRPWDAGYWESRPPPPPMTPAVLLSDAAVGATARPDRQGSPLRRSGAASASAARGVWDRRGEGAEGP